MENKYLISCETHQGNIRKVNDDNFLCNYVYKEDLSKGQFEYKGSLDKDKKNIFAIFDGMGGLNYGNVASLIGVKTLKDCIYKNNCFDIEYIIRYINQLICLKKKELHTNIGSTIVLGCIEKNHLNIYNLGDSRAYILRDKSLIQLSQDHTEEDRMLKLGIKNISYKNILTQHLGIDEEEFLLEPAFKEVLIENKDIILLCSDGLTSMLNNKEIEDILNKNIDITMKREELIQEALNKGGNDNITVILVEI